MIDDRLILTERGFLRSEALPGRQWFKHLIYGPHGDTGSMIDFFPGIADAICRKNAEREARIRHEIWRVARAIQRGASALRGEFSPEFEGQRLCLLQSNLKMRG
ncbi:Glutamate carboxypeptidase [Handroanthus impetiginosus]|uniref:Glutamate carboxypeptidase n=1 Tax=Handroanthus impetiginosus TaxID=429701 RepID=A0A2G9H3S9_9LAMI|nr:Glutamate carboxypeptidase [Handroanthus impetiginosus]